MKVMFSFPVFLEYSSIIAAIIATTIVVNDIIVERFANHLPLNFESTMSPIHENHAGCPYPLENNIVAMFIITRY